MRHHDFHLNGLPLSEMTHPPLGKILISIGIALFGMVPFGWRCVCALFGAMMVPLMYLFAWRIFRKTWAAVTATMLLCTECMHFTLSRIATLDIIIAFFILLMFYLMYCFADGLMRGCTLSSQYGTLFLCGCATGCANCHEVDRLLCGSGNCGFILFGADPILRTEWVE